MLLPEVCCPAIGIAASCHAGSHCAGSLINLQWLIVCRHVTSANTSLSQTLQQLYLGAAQPGPGAPGHIMYSDQPPLVDPLGNEDSSAMAAFTRGKGVMVRCFCQVLDDFAPAVARREPLVCHVFLWAPRAKRVTTFS